MVRIGLQFKATMENIYSLSPVGEDFRWYLKIRCANCGEQPDKWIYATLAESSPLKGGRGSASLVAKCKMCGRENSLDIMADSIAAYDINGAFKTIVVFDCRGLEPVDFSPRVGFQAIGEATFDDVSLTDLEWTDYDEKVNQPVSILDVEHKFIKL
ncbi:CXXC motif containing zinc binding protein-like isoform X2 [Dysidea avara]|uniref:CXXC motif containing zinc binding protein-like isoform X2 n=1 Tax=Dysidea avara TaxID=196820 RepID=UPI00331AF1E6